MMAHIHHYMLERKLMGSGQSNITKLIICHQQQHYRLTLDYSVCSHLLRISHKQMFIYLFANYRTIRTNALG
jgi:hypothetical protein